MRQFVPRKAARCCADQQSAGSTNDCMAEQAAADRARNAARGLVEPQAIAWPDW